MDDSTHQQHEQSLADQRLVFVGKLVSMSRREAEQLVRERGGRVLDRLGPEADLIVVSDDAADLSRLISNSELFDDSVRAAITCGDVELVRESELWTRLGLVGSGAGIERLYTPAMLAELVKVPVATIRHWQRRGALLAKREVRRLAYFDFEEVRVARKLAQLLAAGCSLAVVNRRLDELARLLPGSPRPLVDPAVVVEGRRLLVRREEGLAEPSGQMLIDFDVAKPQAVLNADDRGQIAVPFAAAEALRNQSASRPRAAHPYAAEDLRSLAAELSEDGRPQQAVEAYRALLFSGEFVADDHFDLAELLYQEGDLSAARERYYVAIELDENFVEARSNLGCVLAEQGDLGLAEAAFRGALEYHPDYADAHYHLARLLDRANRAEEASWHWQFFTNLAPASPWADEARERIAGLPSDY
ncbi:MAG: tetratricopeptide repeat protein [Planctomycetes bacterium]|nr:tetratricopeptide repeat protein [Planctomycetota bacterium]